MVKISKKRFNELADKYRIPVGDEKALDAVSGVVVTDFINALNDELNKPKNKWIPWNGGDCPVDPKTKVHIKFQDGEVYKDDIANSLNWKHLGLEDHDIIAYKVIDN